MLFAWSGISIIYSSCFLASYNILCILGLKLIGFFFASLINSCKCRSFVSNCLFYCFFKGKRKEHTFCLRRYQKIGNSSINFAILYNLCGCLFLCCSQLIGCTIVFKRSISYFNCIKCCLLEIKSHLCIIRCCAEYFLGCKCNFAGNCDLILTSGLLNCIGSSIYFKGIGIICHSLFIAFFDFICYFCISNLFISRFSFQCKNGCY